ncbi:MAG TPA: hypothetical protein VKT82_14385 [Ktedonobacterales bacterium]|nr:hypothetical protein [Ktedonobacterales bacterium]
MSMTPEEAQASLQAIRKLTGQTHRALYHGTGYFPIIWGLVWAGGFLGYQYLPFIPATLLWVALLMVGGLASGVVGARLGQRVRSTNGARIGLFFAVLIGYAYLWLWIARPLSLPQMELLLTLAVLFGMLATGLWLRVSYLIVFGVVVSALAVAGYYALPASFGLWMAVLVGSAFVGSGVYQLRCGY